MTWTFCRLAGTFCDDAGALLTDAAYSGHGEGLNNPDLEAVPNVGPIPGGLWSIGRPRVPVDHLGPLAMPLTPAPGTDALGRTALFIHGDNAALDHSASDGCLILPHDVRARIAESDDAKLMVV